MLLPVVDKFPNQYIIPYNLAGYACQLGNVKEVWDWLQKASDLAGTSEVKLMALDDPDLEPLWKEKILLALAQHLKDAGGLDLRECSVNGTFFPAKKGGAWSGKASGARAPRSWVLQTAICRAVMAGRAG